ncbi:MAG: MEDS domain-containing protein [Smithellaceae bacterium]
MNKQHRPVSLGFTRQEFEPGVHVCQIFSDDSERFDSLLNFLVSGLQAGERTCCFSDSADQRAIEEHLNDCGVSYRQAISSKMLSISGTSEAYFINQRFDPDHMIKMLRDYYLDALDQGYGAARVIGEMAAEIQHISGGSRLLEYECKVSLLQRECPVTAVCQYDARLFDGAMIMDVLKVHPLMVIRGSVVRNPFYISPEAFLNP